MSRVVKNVIVWVLALAVILCIIAGFTFGLSSVSGVADAEVLNNLVNNGVVRDNLIPYSSANQIYSNMISSSPDWTLSNGSNVRLTDDGYLTFTPTDSWSQLNCSLDIQYDTSYYVTVTICCRVNQASSSKSYLAVEFSNGVTQTYSFYFNSSSDVGTLKIYSENLQFASNSLKSIELRIRGYSMPVFDIAWVKLEVSQGAGSGGFTGYVPYNKGSYDEGYDDGYDKGYDVGFNDGLVSVNDVFVCSAVDIEYDSEKNYIYFNPNDVYASYSNVLVNSFAMAFVPLSCLRYDEVDGGFYPVDIVRNSEGELPDVKTSAYYMRFQSLLEVGQWLLDNPDDYLCSYVISGGAEPAAIIFADLSYLEIFMTGVGAAYDDGYDIGYDDGYDDGDGAGYNRGYGVGFNDGQTDASSGNYTFLALIGSVLDAPITAFKGLLDFELLGVNMSSFVLAIMSLCVIIVIIRVVLR